MNVQRSTGAMGAGAVDSGKATVTVSAEASETADLLPLGGDLALEGDLGAQLAAMMLKSAHEQKGIAKIARDAADRSQEAAEGRELMAMRDAAQHHLYAGLIEGGSSAAAGACQISGALSSKTGAACWKGSGEGTKGVGQGVKAAFGAIADDDDVRAKAAAQFAAQHQRAGTSAREAERDAKDGIKRTFDLYKQYLQAKAETQKAALLRA